MSSSAREALGLPEPALRLMVDAAPDMIVLLQPDGRCRHVSSASLPLLGHEPEALSGADLRDLVIDDDRPVVGDLLGQLAGGSRAASVALRVRRAGGGWVWMEGAARRVPAGAGVVLALRDITARKQDEAVLEEANSLLRRRAAEDGSTGLANRGHFVSMLERELRRARRDGIGLTVLAAEMDAFALYADLYGFEAGEAAIRQIAACARAALRRPGDLAGRLGGATIGVMLPATVASGAEAVAQRLASAASDLHLEHAGSPSGFMAVSVGIACSTPRSVAGELVEAAEHDARVRAGTARSD